MRTGKKVRVLIAADNEVIRIGPTRVLGSQSDISILGEACDKENTVEKAERLRPQVVLLKMDLPKHEVVKLAQRINKIAPDAHILLVDFHCTREDFFYLLSTGVRGYCLLNTEISRLREAIISVAEAVLWIGPGVIEKSSEAVPMRQSEWHLNNIDLTDREREVLRLLVEGMTNQQIGVALCLSVETIKTHMRHILEKLHVTDRTKAVVKALKQGIV